MGKVTRMRRKLHNAAQKPKAQDKKDSSNNGDEDMADISNTNPPPLPLDPTALGARGENLFKDIKIQSTDLAKQRLPDFDARSTVTSKTFKGLNLTKKEKQKIRRETWNAKIEHLKTAEKQKKESKKKAQKAKNTPIVGNVASLLDALPTLDLLTKETSVTSTKQSEQPKKARSTQKEKKRKVQMMKDISLFKQVSKHPLFKRNKKRTILEHVKIAVEKQVV